jgi:hypothetical protein
VRREFFALVVVGASPPYAGTPIRPYDLLSLD